MASFAELRRAAASGISPPLVRLLRHTPLTPTAVTWLGFGLTILAAILVAGGSLIVGAVFVLVAGLCDMLDGALARLTGQVTRFGAILDSTLDRLSEGALLVGALAFFAGQGQSAVVVLTGVALVGSLAVSYVRARAEGLGLESRAGFFTRPERVIVLALGLLLNQLVIAIAIIAVLSLATVAQRLYLAWRQLRG